MVEPGDVTAVATLTDGQLEDIRNQEKGEAHVQVIMIIMIIILSLLLLLL